jgi:hypothetical protein
MGLSEPHMKVVLKLSHLDPTYDRPHTSSDSGVSVV